MAATLSSLQKMLLCRKIKQLNIGSSVLAKGLSRRLSSRPEIALGSGSVAHFPGENINFTIWRENVLQGNKQTNKQL